MRRVLSVPGRPRTTSGIARFSEADTQRSARARRTSPKAAAAARFMNRDFPAASMHAAKHLAKSSDDRFDHPIGAQGRGRASGAGACCSEGVCA